MKYKIIERLSQKDYKDLTNLIELCDGYEPFYLTDTCPSSDEEYCEYTPHELYQLAAYDDSDNMIGFISFIYIEDFNCPEVLGNKDDYYKDLRFGFPKDLPELTALVAPNYRHRGIFSEMFDSIKSATGMNDFIISGNLNKEPAFLEHLMKLTYEEYRTYISEECFDTPYNFSFAEDESCYFMYDAILSSETTCGHIAHCYLSHEPSFTVISGVYVDEHLRGRGLGSIFMKNFIHDYFTKCKKPLILNVRNINIPAISIYQNCGFEVTETVKYYMI